MRARLWHFLLLFLTVAAIGAYTFQRSWEVEGLPWRVYFQRWEIAQDVSRWQTERINLHLSLMPESARLSGEGSLQIWAHQEGGDQPGQFGEPKLPIWLMLQPELELTGLSQVGAPLPHWKKDYFRKLEAQVPVSGSTLDFSLDGQLPAPAIVSAEFTAYSATSFWYPRAPDHFAPLHLTLNLPEGWRPVLGGNLKEGTSSEGTVPYTWVSPRPVMETYLIVTRERSQQMHHGEVVLNTLGSQAQEFEQELAKIGRIYGYFSSLLGPSDLKEVHCLFSRGLTKPETGDAGVLLLPARELTTADLAEAVARLWWPGRVDGRWFSLADASAGEWMHEAIPQYLAWQAVKYMEGEQALIEHIKRLTELTPPRLRRGPLRQRERWQTGAAGGEADGAERLYMTQVAGILALAAGEEHFPKAVRAVLERYRYTTIPHFLLQGQLELISEKDLEETMRVWFGRSGPVNFKIASVRHVDGHVHILVINTLNMPAPFPLEIEVDGKRHAVSVGAQGGELKVPLQDVPRKVELDPRYLMPEIERDENVWVAVPAEART